MSAQANSHQKGSGRLNVIFHGAFTFDQSREADRILVLIPDLEYHVYRAGSWLAETELRGRDGSAGREVSYDLRGVRAGSAKFDPKRNLMVKSHGKNGTKAVPYATLAFPSPKEIASLRLATIPRTAFTHAEDLVVDGDQNIATVQVFTYEIEDQNTLRLQARNGDGHYWEPVFTGNYINLHIFSAEENFHKPSNAKEDFNQCVKLLSGLSLELQTNSLRPSEVQEDITLPDGIDTKETETLALRTQRLARLGRLAKEPGGGDLNLAWYGNDALDGSDEACAGPVA